MTPVIAVILLILTGFILLLLEIMVIPGTTIVGIIGFLLLAAGIWVTFDQFGVNMGLIAIGSTLAASVLIFMFIFKSNTWKKLMLKENIESKVEAFDKYEPEVGEEGVAISRLAPMGKIVVNGHEFEAKAQSSFIDEKSVVEIIGVESNKVIVKLKS